MALTKQQLAKRDAPKPFALACRFHTSGNTLGKSEMRVWRVDWSGDQFDILTSERFAEVLSIMEQFGVPVYFLDTEEDTERYEDCDFTLLVRLTSNMLER